MKLQLKRGLGPKIKYTTERFLKKIKQAIKKKKIPCEKPHSKHYSKNLLFGGKKVKLGDLTTDAYLVFFLDPCIASKSSKGTTVPTLASYNNK